MPMIKAKRLTDKSSNPILINSFALWDSLLNLVRPFFKDIIPRGSVEKKKISEPTEIPDIVKFPPLLVEDCLFE